MKAWGYDWFGWKKKKKILELTHGYVFITSSHQLKDKIAHHQRFMEKLNWFSTLDLGYVGF